MTFGEFLIIHTLVTALASVSMFGIWRHSKKLGWPPGRQFSNGIAAPLMVVGFSASGLAYWLLNPKAGYHEVMLCATFGVLVGLASGHLIGWFLWRYYRKEIEGDEDAR